MPSEASQINRHFPLSRSTGPEFALLLLPASEHRARPLPKRAHQDLAPHHVLRALNSQATLLIQIQSRCLHGSRIRHMCTFSEQGWYWSCWIIHRDLFEPRFGIRLPRSHFYYSKAPFRQDQPRKNTSTHLLADKRVCVCLMSPSSGDGFHFLYLAVVVSKKVCMSCVLLLFFPRSSLPGTPDLGMNGWFCLHSREADEKQLPLLHFT